MRIKKSYQGVSPELLYDEIRDFALKQGVEVDTAKMDTYSSPGDSSSYVSRGTLTFTNRGKPGEAKRECLMVHIVGPAKGEIKVLLDIDEELFSQDKVSAFQEDLDFVFSSYKTNAT